MGNINLWKAADIFRYGQNIVLHKPWKLAIPSSTETSVCPECSRHTYQMSRDKYENHVKRHRTVLPVHSRVYPVIYCSVDSMIEHDCVCNYPREWIIYHAEIPETWFLSSPCIKKAIFLHSPKQFLLAEVSPFYKLFHDVKLQYIYFMM